MTKPLRIIGLIVSAFFVISMLLGFRFTDGFAGNLLAECAGLGLSTLVGVFIVDHLISLERQRRWARARQFILSSIVSHLSDAMIELFVFIPDNRDHKPMDPIIAGRRNLSAATVQALREITRQMDLNSSSSSPDRYVSDHAIDWYKHVRWDLDGIQSMVLWAIEAQADQEIVDGLLAFDRARRNFHSATIGH